MKWTAIVVSALLLAGCSGSTPELEDVPPTAMASTAPGAAGAAGVGRAVELTPEERSAVELGVRHGLAGSNPPEFGAMAATVSKVTSKSYIVCGWVKPEAATPGYEPFLAMYVPEMKIALLIGVGGREPAEGVRKRCTDEGVPLPS